MDDYRRITSDQLRDLQKRGEKVLVVDVRKPSFYQSERIVGSVNVPLEDLNPDEVLKNAGKRPIVLVCTSGKLAYEAADRFYASEIRDISVMAGGLLAWKVLGFPIERD